MILLTALVVDTLFRDPPNSFHPVVWMGTAIAAAKRRAPEGGKSVRLLYGALLALLGTTVAAATGRLLTHLLAHMPRLLRWLLGGVLLKMMLSLRGLTNAGLVIEEALAAGDLPEARRLLGWHLVSRDTGALDRSQVAAGTVESLAENASDSFVAPLIYYALLGLPGALAYRFANTADAMLGYHDPQHEWLGKVPARLDDLLNLIPARLTALALVAAAGLTAEKPGRALLIWRRDRRRTASPNAGHPMSAAAGALGVALEKVGHYTLGEGLPPPDRDAIVRMVRLLRAAALLASALALLLAWRMEKGR